MCTSCRLVYDDHNHFQSFDVDEGDAAPGVGDLDFYDYDDSAPAGCQRGMDAHLHAQCHTCQHSLGGHCCQQGSLLDKADSGSRVQRRLFRYQSGGATLQ